MLCKGTSCFVAVVGSFDRAAASTRCQEISSGATLAYMEDINDRFLASSVAAMSGAAPAWLEAQSMALSDGDRTAFSWSSSDDTTYIELESSWNGGEPNQGGLCTSVDGRIQDQDCADTLTAAVCRLSAGMLDYPFAPRPSHSRLSAANFTPALSQRQARPGQ